MTPPPIKKTLEGVLTDTRERLDLVERRLAKGTGGTGGDVEPAYDSGWVDIKSQISWGTGWSLAGGTQSVKVRRVGAVVQMIVLYAAVAAGTFSVPTNGNITNSIVFTGLPEEFRPAPGTHGAGVTGNTGSTASFQIAENGTVYLAAMAPDATLTASASNVALSFTIIGTWLADGSKPLGPAAQVEDAPSVLAGLIMAWDSDTIPSGWLLCDGSLVSRAAYPELFATIGITHGAGDGSSTFALPNYKGRTLVGRDPADTAFDALGETGGEKAHTLTTAEMPAHAHGFAGGASLVAGNGSSGTLWQNAIASGNNFRGTSITNTGGGGEHNNLQPYAVANWIISTGSGTVGGGGSSTPALPDPQSVSYNSTHTFAGGAATWADFTTPLTVTLDLPNPAWVAIDGSGYIVGTAAAYGMIGVAATGALTLGPEVDQSTGNTTWFGYTAFSELAAYGGKTLSFHKTLLLPKGVTTLRLQNRRSTASGSPTVGYPTMTVTPLYWAGQPGAVQSVGGMTKIIPGSIVNGTLAGNGDVVFAAGTTSVSINGVFTDQFRNYKIVVEVDHATVGSAGLKLRKNGVDEPTANYGCAYNYNTSNTVLAAAYNILNYFAWSGVGCSSQFVSAELHGPALPVVKKWVSDMAGTGASGIGAANCRMSSFYGIAASTYDGLTVLVTSGTTMAGRISIYGMD